jgi:hypothetical protein
MYQFSRAIYRELARDIDGADCGGTRHAHEQVLHACEAAVTRLATDRHYFARPARALFGDIRPYFPISAQARVWRVVECYLACAQDFVASQPKRGYDAHGNPLECRATTRRGTPCQRDPLPNNGYCPSHQHLAETEEREVRTPIAA